MTKSTFPQKNVFFWPKKWQSQTFWTFSNSKKIKVQLSKLYPTKLFNSLVYSNFFKENYTKISIKHRKLKTSNMNFTKIVKTCVLQKIEHPTLKKSKSNFPSFIQHKKWQSPIFQIYSNHKILQSLFSKLLIVQFSKDNQID
jgi:hypothetical protein